MSEFVAGGAGEAIAISALVFVIVLILGLIIYAATDGP